MKLTNCLLCGKKLTERQIKRKSMYCSRRCAFAIARQMK